MVVFSSLEIKINGISCILEKKNDHFFFHRLPQDVFQTAKIAKLLVMMDKGEGGTNQGKTLREIDLNLESLSVENDGHRESDTGKSMK